MQSLPRAGAALIIRATAVRPLPNIGEIIVRQSDGTENVLPLADIAAVFAPGECLCGAPTEGKWADKHSADCPAIAKGMAGPGVDTAATLRKLRDYLQRDVEALADVAFGDPEMLAEILGGQVVTELQTLISEADAAIVALGEA